MKKAKKKSSKIPLPILIIIYGVLLYACYQSVSAVVLAVFGQTTTGYVDYYSTTILDRTAEAGRSLRVIKDYYFYVGDKTYEGRVMYTSDAAWPDLKEGETRAERIRYLGIFPYVNSTASLADFSSMSDGQILYTLLLPIGCVGLFMFIRSFQKQAIKQDQAAAAKAAKREAQKALRTAKENGNMFCKACGAKLSQGAAFCENCGVKTQASSPGVCMACGAALSENAAFCTNCGAAVNAAAPTQTASPPPKKGNTLGPMSGAGLIGFSDVYYTPEIQEVVRKKLKMYGKLILAVMILPSIIFPVASLIMDDYPMKDALYMGIGLSVILTLFYLAFRRRLRKPIWEGQVIKKDMDYRQRHKDSDSTVAVYTTVIMRDSGKKETLTEWESGFWYSYFSAGDRIRYYPALESYEKYDKSRERVIYCNVCLTMNPIHSDRCKQCNKPLFK